MVESGWIINAYYNCYRDDSIVVYTLLLINIVVFKLSILKQHRFIISYFNRLPTMFALILIYFLFFIINTK